MTDYETAFKKPFSDVKKLLIAMVLNIIPIVNFFVYGYFIEVAKSSANKKTIGILPEWKNWGSLFVNALLALVISLAYALPLILMAFIVGFKVFLGMFTGDIVNLAALSGMGAWLVLVLLYGFFFIYVLPSAILSFAFSGKFASAFEFGNVLRKAFNAEYFVAWLVSIVYSAIASVVLGFIPYVGRAIGGAITGITMFTLLGEAYSSLESAKPFVVKKKK